MNTCAFILDFYYQYRIIVWIVIESAAFNTALLYFFLHSIAKTNRRYSEHRMSCQFFFPWNGMNIGLVLLLLDVWTSCHFTMNPLALASNHLPLIKFDAPGDISESTRTKKSNHRNFCCCLEPSASCQAPYWTSHVPRDDKINSSRIL